MSVFLAYIFFSLIFFIFYVNISFVLFFFVFILLLWMLKKNSNKCSKCNSKQLTPFEQMTNLLFSHLMEVLTYYFRPFRSSLDKNSDQLICLEM